MAREVPETKATFTQPVGRPSHEEITQRAYEIFIERGRPEGRAMEHWLEAEGQLVAAAQSQTKTSEPGASRRKSASTRPAGRRT
jgi:hypothetical protein